MVFKRPPKELKCTGDPLHHLMKNQALFHRPILSLFTTKRFLFCFILLVTYDINTWYLYTKNIKLLELPAD